MTPSTKILLKILIGSAALAAVFGVIVWLTNDHDFSGVIAGIAAAIAGVTFIAFLIALIVSAGKGK
ncbi:MAG: hypothetical protein NTW29_01625 [Bacteroidetes bacterium]|nr:hypothetical protein [Bacteroidota bacterium]